MARPRASAALLALALLLVPTVVADPLDDVRIDLAEAPSVPVKDMVQCLIGPHIPETFAYYILWGCTLGMYVPEPVYTYTGCRVVFAGQVQCSGGLSDLVHDLTGCRIGTPTYCQL